MRKTGLIFIFFVLTSCGTLESGLALAQDNLDLTPAQESALAVVSKAREVDAGPIQEAMKAAIGQHPETDRWSGSCGGTVFSVVAVEFPRDVPRVRARNGLISRAGLFAAAELVTSHALMAVWQKERLDDLTTLKAAVLAVTPRLESEGCVRFARKFSRIYGDFAVACIVADEQELCTELTQQAGRSIVKDAYRETMQRHISILMDRKEWESALASYRHLCERELTSPQLCLDAARCFIELNQLNEACQVSHEAYSKFKDIKDAAFFEAVGDILLLFEDEVSQNMAESAYVKAFEIRYGDEH